MTKTEILHTLKHHTDYLKKHFGIKKIGLFGSYAHGTQTDESDIDFYVEFTQKSFDNLAGLWVYLEQLYDKKIDIIHKHKNNNKVIISNIHKLQTILLT